MHCVRSAPTEVVAEVLFFSYGWNMPSERASYTNMQGKCCNTAEWERGSNFVVTVEICRRKGLVALICRENVATLAEWERGSNFVVTVETCRRRGLSLCLTITPRSANKCSTITQRWAKLQDEPKRKLAMSQRWRWSNDKTQRAKMTSRWNLSFCKDEWATSEETKFCSPKNDDWKICLASLFEVSYETKLNFFTKFLTSVLF